MNTSRAYLGADTTLTLWLRDDDGKIAFVPASDDATMYLYPYGSSVKVEETGLVGVIDTLPTGRAIFTITEAYAEANLPRGSYRYVVKLNAAQVSDGLLEVV